MAIETERIVVRKKKRYSEYVIQNTPPPPPQKKILSSGSGAKARLPQHTHTHIPNIIVIGQHEDMGDRKEISFY